MGGLSGKTIMAKPWMNSRENKMGTHKDIQDEIKQKHGFSVKSCWIAHVKEINGLKPKQSPNRISPSSRKHPCPKDKRTIIEESMRKFNLI